jgi:quercetin dioxygenase-like cupin family protein
MKTSVTAVLVLSFFAATAAWAQQMEVSPSKARPAADAPTANFTGKVEVTPLYRANETTSSTGGLVRFSPGARSAWHTHPAGQMLIITDGTGWVQEEGQPRREVKKGDVIWTPPGVKHWHGATSTTAMSHIAISNMRDGKNVDWMEPVSDDQYRH